MSILIDRVLLFVLGVWIVFALPPRKRGISPLWGGNEKTPLRGGEQMHTEQMHTEQMHTEQMHTAAKMQTVCDSHFPNCPTGIQKKLCDVNRCKH